MSASAYDLQLLQNLIDNYDETPSNIERIKHVTFNIFARMSYETFRYNDYNLYQKNKENESEAKFVGGDDIMTLALFLPEQILTEGSGQIIESAFNILTSGSDEFANSITLISVIKQSMSDLHNILNSKPEKYNSLFQSLKQKAQILSEKIPRTREVQAELNKTINAFNKFTDIIFDESKDIQTNISELEKDIQTNISELEEDIQLINEKINGENPLSADPLVKIIEETYLYLDTLKKSNNPDIDKISLLENALCNLNMIVNSPRDPHQANVYRLNFLYLLSNIKEHNSSAEDHRFYKAVKEFESKLTINEDVRELHKNIYSYLQVLEKNTPNSNKLHNLFEKFKDIESPDQNIEGIALIEEVDRFNSEIDKLKQEFDELKQEFDELKQEPDELIINKFEIDSSCEHYEIFNNIQQEVSNYIKYLSSEQQLTRENNDKMNSLNSFTRNLKINLIVNPQEIVLSEYFNKLSELTTPIDEEIKDKITKLNIRNDNGIINEVYQTTIDVLNDFKSKAATSDTNSPELYDKIHILNRASLLLMEISTDRNKTRQNTGEFIMLIHKNRKILFNDRSDKIDYFTRLLAKFSAFCIKNGFTSTYHFENVKKYSYKLFKDEYKKTKDDNDPQSLEIDSNKGPSSTQ